MDGLLVVDKPAGPTSHDIVARVRRTLGERRVGHTGTLDPAASGVLPLVLGRATRLARFLNRGDKRYEALVQLGVATDTYDAQGVPVGAVHRGPLPSREAIEQALESFRGTFLQRPPAYSAKKIAGTRSYLLARRARAATPAAGNEDGGSSEALDTATTPEPVAVTTDGIDIIAVTDGIVTLDITCSAGFYVRSLAHDLGQMLGTGAHLAGLRRTRSGDFTLADAVAIDEIDASRVIPLAGMLPRLSAATLTEQGERRLAHGRDLGPDDVLEPQAGDARPVRLIDQKGDLVGIAEPAAAPGFLHPSIVLM